MPERFQKTVDIKAVDEAARTATGAVLVPNELDHQQDFLRPDAVGRFHSDDVDTGVMHSAFPDAAAELERNEVIDSAEEIGDETFPEGTWVATRHYEDDDLWQLVDDGVLQGFSIGGEISRAAEHDDLPEDVRVPDSVDHESGGTELIAGTVEEVSDVDIPAVPRASYKSDLGKAILDDVDSEAEFVELMTEQRGHDESDARQLYQYLTDVRETKRRDVLHSVGKPFESPQGAEFEDFEDCVDTLLAEGELDRAEAEEICGAWQDESKNKVEVNGETVDLTPPGPVVNAAEAALEAKRDRFADTLGDCGSGVGEDRAERIIANDLRPEDFVGGENTAIPDYLDSHSEDVQGIDEPPTDWSEETWTDGCGPVQYALWGGTATGTGLEWANSTEQELRDAMETENMTETDNSIDDATKLQVIKSWLTGSDDASAAEAPDAAKATDGDDEDDEDDEEDEEMAASKDATAGETADTDMSNDDTTSDPPEWAKSLTDTVEQIDERVSKLESDDDDEDAEKSMADAPEWAEDLAEKVEDLDERVDTISKQSGHSQQLDATEKNDGDETDEVETFKAGLVGGR